MAAQDIPRDRRPRAELHAIEAPTEVQLDQDRSTALAYVDLTGGDGARRPVVPEHWRTWGNAKRHLSLAAARHGHRTAYHGVRSPAYFAKAARVRGVRRDRRHRAPDRLVAHPGHDPA